MNNTSKPLTVRILEKDYRIACPPEEQAILFRTADYVNQAMALVKKNSLTLSTERIAVLAALNIARELIENNPISLQASIRRDHDEQLIEKIDAALREFDQT